jgi:hypothetical protein
LDIERQLENAYQEKGGSLLKRLQLIYIIVLLLIVAASSSAQFPEKWVGTWSGMMHIYKAGKIVDSVAVTHLIKPGERSGDFTWRTEYASVKNPVVKDYVLRIKDAARGLYVIDEGEGLELTSYLMGSRLLSTFEVSGIFLTANYELRGEELIFEVTSGKKDAATGGGVTNYSVNTLQRVVLKRAEVAK